MNDLDDLIRSLRPETDDAYQRRGDSDLARIFATSRRRSFSRRLRWAVMAIPLALVGVVAAVELAPAPPDDGIVMAASVQQVLSTGTGESAIAVYLCKQDSPLPSCGGGTDHLAGGGSAITEQEKDAVEKTLTTMTGVENVTFIDKAEMYDKFRNDRKTGSKLLEIVTVEDMPESFRVTLKPGADWRAVMEAAKGMPGVASVIDQRCGSPC
ncbi:permease-like cell division protein FtsX [Nonomuraea dietziae]|uniref:permease-like cell division protein FtsX n=1 Tax=Nonomuraea dietziae TaxID=65515 RepID=UPI0033E84058